MEWRAIYIFKYCSTLKSLLLFFHNYLVTCGTSAFDVSMYVWTWKTLAVGGFIRYLRKAVFFKSPFSLNPNVPSQFNPCVSWQMLYFEHHYKFRTILNSLELKNYTKLWVHGNWGRTETGDTTVLCISVAVLVAYLAMFSPWLAGWLACRGIVNRHSLPLAWHTPTDISSREASPIFTTG